MAAITKRTGKSGTTYKVQIRLKGHPPETASFHRLTDARAWATRTEADMKAGRYFGIAKRRTFPERADKYEESIVGALKSAAWHSRRLARWRAEFADTVLEDVTPAAIAEVRDKLLQETTPRGLRTPATVNRYLASLSSCLSFGVRELQWIERNPCERVRKGKESAGRVRFLSDEERTRLLAECKASRNPSLYLAVVLALTTGARQSEVLGLRWPQIDFDRRTILLRDGDTKNGSGRVLPLTGEAFDLLRERAKVRTLHDDRLFPAPASGRVFDGLRTAWETALDRAEITDFRWHDLRHTAASFLMMSGISSMEIAKVLGHRTLAMTARYSHLADERTVEIGDVLTTRLGLKGKSNTAARR